MIKKQTDTTTTKIPAKKKETTPNSYNDTIKQNNLSEIKPVSILTNGNAMRKKSGVNIVDLSGGISKDNNNNLNTNVRSVSSNSVTSNSSTSSTSSIYHFNNNNIKNSGNNKNIVNNISHPCLKVRTASNDNNTKASLPNGITPTNILTVTPAEFISATSTSSSELKTPLTAVQFSLDENSVKKLTHHRGSISTIPMAGSSANSSFSITSNTPNSVTSLSSANRSTSSHNLSKLFSTKQQDIAMSDSTAAGNTSTYSDIGYNNTRKSTNGALFVLSKTPSPKGTKNNNASLSKTLLPASPQISIDDSKDNNDTNRKNSMFQMPGDFTVPSKDNTNKKEGGKIVSHSQELKQKPSGNNTNSSASKTIIGDPNTPHLPFTDFFQKKVDDAKIHILIGATGSVATIKIPLIINKFFKKYTPEKVSIQLILTKSAERFLKGAKISSNVKIWTDEDEWFGFKKIGDPIFHTELRKWADIFLIVPLSANTLAKISNGICDNLLTCIVREWNSNVPIYVAPAMNTFMYINPMTKKHLKLLQEDFPHVEVLKPVEKVLVCGDIGMGGMREWTDIVEIVVRRLKLIRGTEIGTPNNNFITENNNNGDHGLTKRTDSISSLNLINNMNRNTELVAEGERKDSVTSNSSYNDKNNINGKSTECQKLNAGNKIQTGQMKDDKNIRIGKEEEDGNELRKKVLLQNKSSLEESRDEEAENNDDSEEEEEGDDDSEEDDDSEDDDSEDDDSEDDDSEDENDDDSDDDPVVIIDN
ncbi:uncharacterized protein SCODWIG_01812 [Saccharomycodes ludwigii]|uniref:Flavoprotein domain-containing protein n=1 Tax=Saccharomycodes ludwigii TaxID=36035 RepID=A0A376B5Z0_9ASCO|nr:uncharacterized protein SCODWIG_01812 [Saccharomycodes ludwigii]